jgi:hypothetical protein
MGDQIPLSAVSEILSLSSVIEYIRNPYREALIRV